MERGQRHSPHSDRAKHRFFLPDRGSPQRPRQKSTTGGWAKAITKLIAYGHQWSEIREYTLAQFNLFLEECNELEKERRAIAIADGALAANGDKKGLEKRIRELTK